MTNYSEQLIEAIEAIVHAAVEDCIEATLDARLEGIIEASIADVPVFDISDHASDIEDIVNEVISNTSFSVTVD